jgi:catalase
MAKTKKAKDVRKHEESEKYLVAGPEGATHQTAEATGGALTTNQGVVFASAEGIKPLLKNSAAIDWVRDGFGHLKVIGHTAAVQSLFEKAGIADDLDEGVIELEARTTVGQYIEAAKQQRAWDREARLSEGDA